MGELFLWHEKKITFMFISWSSSCLTLFNHLNQKKARRLNKTIYSKLSFHFLQKNRVSDNVHRDKCTIFKCHSSYLCYRSRQRILPHMAYYWTRDTFSSPSLMKSHIWYQMEVRGFSQTQVTLSTCDRFRHSAILGMSHAVVIFDQDVPPTRAHKTIRRVFLVLCQGSHLVNWI